MGRIAKTSSIGHISYAVLLFFMKAIHLVENLLACCLLTTYYITRWKVSDRRHIAYLIYISDARVLTKCVKIDQSEGISLWEQPFVKFAHKRSFTTSPSTFSIFHALLFYTAFQLTECLEEEPLKFCVCTIAPITILAAFGIPNIMVRTVISRW